MPASQDFQDLEEINPDVALVRRFVAAPAFAMPVDSSPLALALGAMLTAHDRETCEIAVDYAPVPLFRQGAGVVQGGAIAAMLDFAMAFAGMAEMERGDTIATVNLNIVLQRPATAARFVGLGRVDRRGRRVMFTSARLVAGDAVVATATSTLLVSRAGSRPDLDLEMAAGGNQSRE